jgi:RNase P/RNase MRP subunit POP5
MKALKPSHKERKRYLLIGGKNANKEDIEKVILEFIGVLGFAEANPKIIKQNSQSVILSINRESLNKIRASFSVSEKDLEITRVSGSIKKFE